MKEKWNKLSSSDKGMLLARIVISAAIIVLASLQLWGIRENAIHLNAPLMGVVLLLQSIQDWKQHRAAAGFSLCAAAFVFACAMVVWFVK